MTRPTPNGADSASTPLCTGPCRAVVTGGAGFIGSHLVERLLDEGFTVHVVDDLSTGSLDNLGRLVGHEALTVTVGSVATLEVAQRALEGADVVFHLAGVVGVQRLAAEPLGVMHRKLKVVNRAGRLAEKMKSRLAMDGAWLERGDANEECP